MALVGVAALYAGCTTACTLLGENILDDKPLEGASTEGAGASGAAGGNGGGGTPQLDCNEHADCPGLDTTCRYRVCDGGSCGFGNAPAKTSCSEGGVLCDGNGGCVECVDPEDCVSGDSCVMNQCVPPHCVDGRRGDGETDTDCGGPDCVPCDNGDNCLAPLDCQSKFCDEGTCAPCGSSADCAGVPQSYCASDGVCRPKKAQGDSCDGADECLTGYCPGDDGLCCNSACNANCEACLMIKSGSPNGTCGQVAMGQSFDGDCPDQGAPSCGSNGDGCDGSGACILYDASTVCGASSCVGTTLTPPSQCDGAGTCMTSAQTSCAPYTCNTNGACRSSCTVNSHCSSGGYCAGTSECLACGTSPTPPPDTCPGECTGGCPGNTCVINCSGSLCQGVTTICPPNFHCEVNCTNSDSCNSAVIMCPQNHRCQVDCSGNNACNGADVHCGDASCQINCISGVNHCNSSEVFCGDGQCQASCSGTSEPALTCGSACSCTPCP